MGHGVDDGSGTKEEECFEECVGGDMEKPDPIGTDSASDEHVAELGDGGISEDFFDIGLSEGDKSPEEGGDRAEDCDNGSCGGGKCEEFAHPVEEENPGGDHCGSVDQSRDGGWASHRIGEPDIEGELGGFAHSSDEEEDTGGGQYPRIEFAGDSSGVGKQDIVAEPAGFVAIFAEHNCGHEGEGEHPESESPVTDAVDDEGFVGSEAVGFIFVPKADEKVGADTDAFPAEKEKGEVIAEH